MIDRYILATLSVFLWLANGAVAQYATVKYDYELNRFGENQPLPAEQAIIFTGVVPPGIDLVEIQVLAAKGKKDREPLATGAWKRPFDKTSNTFNLPISYRLRGSKEYDVVINFYRSLSDSEKEQLYERLTANLDTYLTQALGIDKRGIDLGKNSKQIIADLNQIVWGGLAHYRNWIDRDFPGFSDIVRNNLEALDKYKAPKEADSTQLSYRRELIDELREMVHAEVAFLLNQQLAQLVDSRLVDNYETEKKDSYFALNLGYGGVYLDGKVDQSSSFGSAPYLGLGFPFSTSAVAPKFLQDASLTLGFFTSNFDDDNGKSVTGPIFNRPLYAGLDYKLFSFFRINAGAALLEKIDETSGGGEKSDIFVRPFLGISAKINISLSLDK